MIVLPLLLVAAPALTAEPEPCRTIDAACLASFSMERRGPEMEVIDPGYLALVARGLNVVPDLLDLLDDATQTDQPVPLFAGKWAVGDIAHRALYDIVPDLPWLELVTGRTDPENDSRYLTCGFCAYWERVRESPANRTALQAKARTWFRENRDQLRWKAEPDRPTKGAYVLDKGAGGDQVHPILIVDLEPDTVAERDVDLRRFRILFGRTVSITDLELGDVVEGATVELAVGPAPAGEWRLQMQYETSLSISDEGPHLDLLDWKHHTSEWRDLERLSPTRFRVPTLTEEEQERFPSYRPEELREAVLKAGDEGWLELLGGGSVGVSSIRLRVIAPGAEPFVVAFSIAMGC